MKSLRSDALDPVVLDLCEAIDTPRSLSVWLRFKYNQEALLDLPPTDVAVCDTQRVRLDYFISEYLSKYKGLSVKVDVAKVALDKWKLGEVQCKVTNDRFRFPMLRPNIPGRVASVIFDAQRKIARVLGGLKLPIVLADCKWGPGATFDMRREVATPDKKISHPLSVTAQALPFLRAVLESDPHWAAVFTGVIPEGPYCLTSDCYKVVRGSRFLTVPKSAKTDRCIAAEPTGNGFLQQGIHSYMRRRLKRFGVNLDDQSINQKRAAEAYRLGLSTLDLSAASDTISRELVFHLLPLDWALFLDSIRSHETRVGSEWIRTEKFASMGNAFCFELETLIFWALSASASESLGSVEPVTVYGDDIIVDRRAYDLVVETLQICGFTVNEKKSFKDGYFFESCGKHYHKGVDITPVYQKEVLNTPSELIRAHNRLVRFGTLGFTGDLDGSVTAKAAKRLRSLYPLRPFPRIPYGVCEDGGFLCPVSEFTLDPNHGFRCHVLDYVPRYTGVREDAVYAYHLRRRCRMSYSFREGHQFSSSNELREGVNPLQNGGAANITKGKWRSKIRWIPELHTRPEKV